MDRAKTGASNSSIEGTRAAPPGVPLRSMPYRRVLLPTAVLLALSGCRSVAQPVTEKPASSVTNVPVDASVAEASVVGAPASDASVAASLPPLEWGTRATGAGPLYPIVDGMCIHGTVFPLENGAIVAYGMARGPWSRGGSTTAQILDERGLAPQIDTGIGKAFGFWSPTTIGGSLPNRLFATVDVSSRMVTATDLYVGGSRASDWKVFLESGARFGDAGNAAVAGTPLHALGDVVSLGDGSYMIADRQSLVSAKGEDTETRSFRVFANGAWVPSAKVPGKDLAALAFSGGVHRLGNGEVIATGEGPAKKLVRWSPARAVDDLPLPVVSKRTVRILAGRDRAYLDIDGKLFVYEGDTIVVAKSAPKAAPGFFWAIGADDALSLALPTNVLVREGKDGVVTEETIPFAGALVGFDKGAPWIWSSPKAGSDVLARKVGATWETVPLPAPPFGNELRGPLRVEQIAVVAKDDVLVNVRRVEKGYGWKATEPFRAIYRTKKPDEVLRCQDTRGSDTGIGFHSWPSAADDTCTTPVVVVLAESGKVPAKDYPALRQRLRGKKELGEALTFVSFEGRGTSNLAVLAHDMTVAKALATMVSSALDLRAEVVCGKPKATRTFTYDSPPGTFAFF